MRLSSFAALVAAPVLVVGLVACSGEPQTEGPGTVGTDTPAACAPSGPISEAVSVSDDVGTEPTVDFNAPLSLPAVQRTVITDGDGAELQDGATAKIHFTVYNGETGDRLDSTGYEPTGLFEATLDDTVLLSGLVQTLRCTTVGSRVVGVVPPSAAFGDAGNDQIGVGPGQSVVFIVDVVDVVEPLKPAAWTSDVPEVVFGSDGTPTVTLPAGDPPAELLMDVIEKGDGETVTASDAPKLDYQGTSWDTGEVFDQSFGGDPIALPATQYVKGFTAAILGQKVGSTLLVSIPPDYAYGPDANAHPLGGQTLLFVIEILSIS
ncbi:MAG TPA: FKBP-type peptidyl-prolyl cis-trans isomerase [Pseudolysinimonas sp.]|nr:FKBP-type peptidyl-prolyl cis-trans isomerase [Pseudolysinimonas sp.]